VLIPRLNALDGLATDVFPEARQLAEAFWPGGLTLILHAQPSLDWDLGDTKGTVALRIPADEVAQELLTVTGPLAVSSANRTGQAPAQTAFEARSQLAESVEVYLEGGFRPVEGTDALPSTIVDATSLPLRVVREGAVSLERLREVVPGLLDIDGNGAEPDEAAEPGATTEPESPDREAAAEPEKLAEPEAATAPDAAPAELSESGELEPGEETPGRPAGEKASGAE
jgi:tRNA threonylcarbamoyl adenosine modification protein (Sua5/YciO/YrdC/YwlC family)